MLKEQNTIVDLMTLILHINNISTASEAEKIIEDLNECLSKKSKIKFFLSVEDGGAVTSFEINLCQLKPNMKEGQTLITFKPYGKPKLSNDAAIFEDQKNAALTRQTNAALSQFRSTTNETMKGLKMVNVKN